MTNPRLNQFTLPSLQRYLISQNWSSPEIGIVHLGLGNFHRAHQAVYTEEAVVRSGGNWAICGVTLQGSTAKRDILNDQDGLYSLIQRDANANTLSISRILKEFIALPYDWPALHNRLSDPNIKIVSLTVTEKGYCREPSTGNLQRDHPLISHDLANPEDPRSVPGIILAGLFARMKSNFKPFTVLSCDNLAKNGHAIQRIIIELAEMLEQNNSKYQGLSSWIRADCKFPSTMVDRIVPASTEEDRRTVSEILQVEDQLPLSCEPFRQWVIEDDFIDGRPEWESVGVQLVSDVTPFEMAKLRMLNAAHSTLAYLSLLLDLNTIDEAISQEALRSFLFDMITEEVIPILRPSMPIGFDLLRYRDELFKRFANPALKHKTAQIAADGSQKIPERLLSSIIERDRQQLPYPKLALAVAGWITSFRCHSDQGKSFGIQDPLSELLRGIYHDGCDNPLNLLETLCTRTQIIPPSLQDSDIFRKCITDALTALQQGVLHAISIRSYS